MKRILIFVLTIVLFAGVLPAGMNMSTAATTVFKDVAFGTWYYEHVQYVANDPRQLMVGYAGNFGPLDNLTVEQFIKITVAAAGKSVVVPQGQYWGDVYVPIGLELGFVLSGEFSEYKRPITRAEMARIIIRSLPSITGESGITYNINDIKARMVDYSSIPTHLQDDVCKAYQLGILTGGTDKKFNPNGYLTRASAAAVIHNMLDPSIRPVAFTAELWSDAEFEQYIRDHAKDYYCIAKIESRKIYWKNASISTPTLLSENNNPGVNDLIYNCAKNMAYFAKKNGNIFSCGYSEILGSVVSLDYHIVSSAYSPDIGIDFFAIPEMNYIAERYAPGEQKNPSYYMWTIGVLRDPNFLTDQGWNPGLDRSKFKWTQEKYEDIFNKVCLEIYGPVQGNMLFNFILQKYLNTFYAGGKLEDSFFGSVPNAGVELAYYFSDKNGIKHTEFWTTKPEERK